MLFSRCTKQLLSSLTVAACFSATAAQAATLSGTQGVLVNRGGGFTPVTGPTEVQPGDSIMIQPGGSATVTYGDGCQAPVQSGVVVRVGNVSPCSQVTTNATEQTVPPNPPVENSVISSPPTEEPGLLGGLDTTSLVIGGVALGAGALGVAALSQKKDKKPASP